jgi:hypothetical protein
MPIYALRGGEQDTIDPRDLENTSTPSSAWDELEDVLFDSGQWLVRLLIKQNTAH